MTIGLMGNAEQASITNTVLTTNATVGTAVVTVQNTGSATVDITSATIDANTATITAATVTSGSQVLTWTSGQVPIQKGNTVSITMTVGSAASPYPFVNSAQYTIKLMTAKGNTVTNTATYAGP